MSFTKKGTCHNCKIQTEFILYLQLFANGSENFLWACSRCNQRNPARDPQYYIPAEKVRERLTEAEIVQLPKILPVMYDRCAVCGNRMTERHHWAPRAIFGDKECEQWPMDFLCKDCHDQWHRKVTPQLVDKR